MSEGSLSLHGAYAKIEGHEILCAERYRNLQEKMNWILCGLAGMVVSLLAWMAVQLYTLEPLRASAYSQTTITHATGQR